MKNLKLEELDLKTTEGRIRALKRFNKECRLMFGASGIELSEEALFSVNSGCIDISVKETDTERSKLRRSIFASEVELYYREEGVFINFGSSGSFDKNNKGSYWRTIHAASLLKNWDKVVELVTTYCEKYKALMNLIEEANGKSY
jgi:hypothetical protein